MTDVAHDIGTDHRATGTGRFLRAVSFRNVGAVYVWVFLILIFSLWIPHLFLQPNTAYSILNMNTVTAIVALSVIFPLVTGVFDLSVGSTVGLSAVVAAWLLGNTSLPSVAVVVVVLLVGVLIGFGNAFVILRLNIDSFIATLATGSILAAVTLGVSGNRIMTDGISGEFSRFATDSLLGLQLPVYYLIIIMLIQAFILEKTKVGRLMYATGFNAEATRLAGANVGRLRLWALIGSGVIASFAGLVLVGRIQAADPSGGAAYMIPAFCAAFLGATQFRGGRFNSWGAVVAVLMLGTGSYGLLLAGVGSWGPQVFQGVALIVAVAITMTQRKRARNRG